MPGSPPPPFPFRSWGKGMGGGGDPPTLLFVNVLQILNTGSYLKTIFGGLRAMFFAYQNHP